MKRGVGNRELFMPQMATSTTKWKFQNSTKEALQCIEGVSVYFDSRYVQCPIKTIQETGLRPLNLSLQNQMHRARARLKNKRKECKKPTNWYCKRPWKSCEDAFAADSHGRRRKVREARQTSTPFYRTRHKRLPRGEPQLIRNHEGSTAKPSNPHPEMFTSRDQCFGDILRNLEDIQHLYIYIYIYIYIYMSRAMSLEVVL